MSEETAAETGKRQTSGDAAAGAHGTAAPDGLLRAGPRRRRGSSQVPPRLRSRSTPTETHAGRGSRERGARAPLLPSHSPRPPSAPKPIADADQSAPPTSHRDLHPLCNDGAQGDGREDRSDQRQPRRAPARERTRESNGQGQQGRQHDERREHRRKNQACRDRGAIAAGTGGDLLPEPGPRRERDGENGARRRRREARAEHERCRRPPRR